MNDQPAVTTFLFTDIEGSSRLWEQEPERMQPALARHDAILRSAVERNHGVVVKTTGDGLHAAFTDPRDAVAATVELQKALADPASVGGLPLKVRCGMHAGVIEHRDGDFFGSAVNRASRVMNAAHGGQVLVTQAVADLVAGRLPEGVSLRDLGAVRLRDLSSPERVYQVVNADLRRDFPALRSLESVPNNLPQQLTTFVGRERELQEVKAALAKTRLLTLSGIGGLGKTRLSLQVAADVVHDYPDGVWFVEFAPITDERLVPQAVASVFGVKEEAGRPVIEALVKHVHDRRLLLVLDNCEHLVQACAEIAKQLLQAGAQVKVLASSREHFNIAGETIYTVSPLSVPRQGGTITVESVLQSEAVRLFVERASAVQPAFKLTEQNAPAVVEICQRLDGIPLALELAAARVRALSVEQIASRVNDRFRLLTSGDRTALPRQQTLRALIDWSYDLLTENERILFRRLAVFAGGWTLEAAEAVCSGGDIGEGEVLDLLADLVEKSLVMVEADGGRYGFLETVRQYAEERMSESGEADATRTRHLHYYVAFAERARPGLLGPEQGRWLASLDNERENLLAAHAWCDRAQDGEALGLRLAIATKLYWGYRGDLGVGYRLTIEALARPGVPERSADRCRALHNVGQFGLFMGRYDEASEYLHKALEIAQFLDDKERIEGILQGLGMASLGLGEFAAARDYLQQALHLAEERGRKRGLAAILNELAQLERVQGRLEEAAPLFEQALALARELEDWEVSAIVLLNLAMIAIEQGTLDRACDLLRQASDIVAETGSKQTGQSLLDVCAALGLLSDQPEQAARFLGASEALLKQIGLRRHPADEAFIEPFVKKLRAMTADDEIVAASREGNGVAGAEAVLQARRWLHRCC